MEYPFQLYTIIKEESKPIGLLGISTVRNKRACYRLTNLRSDHVAFFIHCMRLYWRFCGSGRAKGFLWLFLIQRISNTISIRPCKWSFASERQQNKPLFFVSPFFSFNFAFYFASNFRIIIVHNLTMWNYVVTAQKPSSVTHAIVGNFTGPKDINLIIR
jgi:hypothetical protein